MAYEFNKAPDVCLLAGVDFSGADCHILESEMMNIHPTAIVNEGAKLGADVSIGAYAIIEADTQIGDRTKIRPHVSIKRFTKLGSDNIIDEGAVLGGEPQDLSFRDCTSYLMVGDRNR